MKSIYLLYFMTISISISAQFQSHLISSAFSNSKNGLLADFDNDGDLDLIFSEDGIYISMNEDGLGDFSIPVMLSANGGKNPVAIDTDDDGDLDIVHFQSDKVVISENLVGDATQ